MSVSVCDNNSEIPYQWSGPFMIKPGNFSIRIKKNFDESKNKEWKEGLQ
jgi:hypothetical protein